MRGVGRRTLASLFLAGIASLLASLVLPWYQIGANVPGTSDAYWTRFFLRGVQTWSTGVQDPNTFSTSYSNYPLPATGTLYLAVALVIVVSSILGGAMVYLLLVPRQVAGRRRRLLALAAVTCILALSGPLVIATSQPAALCHDAQYFPPPLAGPRSGCQWEQNLGGQAWASYGANPQQSFVGSSSGAGAATAWGPDLGWYAATVGSILFAAGAFAYARAIPAAENEGAPGVGRPTSVSP